MVNIVNTANAVNATNANINSSFMNNVVIREPERGALKALIELAGTVNKADYVVEKYADCETITQKIALLNELFPEVNISDRVGGSFEDDYWSLLSTIINHKWR